MATHHDKQIYLAEGGSLKNGAEQWGKTVQTTDATTTDIMSIPVAQNEAIVVNVKVIAAISDYSAAIGGTVIHTFRRATGNVTAVGGETDTTSEDSAGTPTVNCVADTTNQTVDVRVTGVAAETWNWEVQVEWIKV